MNEILRRQNEALDKLWGGVKGIHEHKSYLYLKLNIRQLRQLREMCQGIEHVTDEVIKTLTEEQDDQLSEAQSYRLDVEGIRREIEDKLTNFGYDL